MAQIVVGTLRVDLVANTATFTPGLDDATRKARKSAQDIQGELNKIDMHEATGSVALLGEMFGIQLPRHVRSFVAELPGVAEVMEKAFAAVAVVALADALLKAYEHFQKLEEAARRAKDAADEFNTKIEVQALGLASATMKINDQINALKNVPAQNKLSIALIDATIQSDALFASLQKDIDAAKKLMEEQSHGAFTSLILGQMATTDLAKKYSEAYDKVRAVLTANRETEADFLREHMTALQSGTAAQKAAAEADLSTLRAKNAEAFRLAVEGKDGALAVAKEQRDAMDKALNVTSSVGILPGPSTEAKVEHIQKLIRDGQTTARDLTSQFTAAVTNLLNVEEQDVPLWKARIQLAQTAKQVIIDMTSEAGKHSVIQKMIAKETKEGIDAENRSAGELVRANEFMAKMDADNLARLEKISATYASIETKTRELADAQAGYATQLAVAQGRLTEQQATEQQLATLQKERADLMDALKPKLDAVTEKMKALSAATFGGAVGSEQEKAAYEQAVKDYQGYKEEQLRIEKEYDGKIAAAQLQLADNFRNSLNKWITNAENVMPQLRNLFFQTVDSFSGTLSKFIVEGNADWKQFAATAIESLLQIGINALIAATVMKALSALLGDSGNDQQKQLAQKQSMNYQGAMSDAALAAANTFALYSATALLPVAAGMASAAYGIGSAFAGLAFFDKGGLIPNTGIAFVHKGEGVFSAPVTSALMRVAQNNIAPQASQDRRSAQVTYAPQFSVWDKAGVGTALEKNRNTIRSMVRRELRRA